MLRPDVAILELAAFLVGVKQYPLCDRRQVQLGRLRYAVAEHDPLLDVAPDGIDGQRTSKRKEPRRDSLVLTHQPEQDVLRGDHLRTVLQGFIASEEDHTP